MWIQNSERRAFCPKRYNKAPLVINHNILQPVTDLGSVYTQPKNKQLISAFNFELLHIKVSSANIESSQPP